MLTKIKINLNHLCRTICFCPYDHQPIKKVNWYTVWACHISSSEKREYHKVNNSIRSTKYR
jgi:hypothetical protein